LIEITPPPIEPERHEELVEEVMFRAHCAHEMARDRKQWKNFRMEHPDTYFRMAR